MKSKHNKKSDVLKPEYQNIDTDKTNSQIEELIKSSNRIDYPITKSNENQQQQQSGLRKSGRMYQSAHEIETMLPPHQQNLEFNDYFSDHFEEYSANSSYKLNFDKMKDQCADNTINKYETTRTSIRPKIKNSKLLKIGSYKEDADCEEANEPETVNDDMKVYHFLDSKQPNLQEEMMNYFEYNCNENPVQRHPFFIGFEEDEVDRFNIVHNEVCYSEKEDFSALNHDTTPLGINFQEVLIKIDGFLTAEEELENESFQSLLGKY